MVKNYQRTSLEGLSEDKLNLDEFMRKSERLSSSVEELAELEENAENG